MFYRNGELVQLNDKVKLWPGCIGLVVCSFDTNEYSEQYPKAEWQYLRKGVLIASDCAGLIHYLDSNEDLELIERVSSA